MEINMKKTTSLALVLVMLFSSLVGIVSFAGAEDDSEPELKVAYANIELANAVYLRIAVDYSEFDSKDGITLKVTNSVTGKTTTLSPSSRIAAPAGCVAFRYADMGLTNMGDEFVIQAYKDGVASGEAKTYSILEYALKAHERGSELLVDLVDRMIKLGASQQKLSGNYGTYNLKDEWALVVASGATARKSIVARGSEVTLTPKDADGAVLYTSALGRLTGNTVVASKPYQSYLFLDETKFTDFYFDFDRYDGDGETVNASFGASVEKSYYSTVSGVSTDASAMTNPVRLTFTSANLTEEAPDGGYLALAQGSLKVAAGKDGGFDASAELPEGIFSDGAVTVTLSIKALEGLTMAGGPVFKTNATEDGGISLYNARNGGIYLGTEGKVAIGGYSTENYLTFHILLDTAAGVISAYDANGRKLGSVEASLGDGAEISSLLWSVGAERGVDVGRCVITKGNLFK